MWQPTAVLSLPSEIKRFSSSPSQISRINGPLHYTQHFWTIPLGIRGNQMLMRRFERDSAKTRCGVCLIWSLCSIADDDNSAAQTCKLKARSTYGRFLLIYGQFSLAARRRLVAFPVLQQPVRNHKHSEGPISTYTQPTTTKVGADKWHGGLSKLLQVAF